MDLQIQSTINNYYYYNLEEDGAESNPKSYQLVATTISDGKKRKVTDTDTTNRNSPHKLCINRLMLEIVPVVIPPALRIADWVLSSSGKFYARQTISCKEIVMCVRCSTACVF